jgi:hypothetical protein
MVRMHTAKVDSQDSKKWIRTNWLVMCLSAWLVMNKAMNNTHYISSQLFAYRIEPAHRISLLVLLDHIIAANWTTPIEPYLSVEEYASQDQK